MNTQPRIANLAALSLGGFIALSILMRLVLPFGDEPDYSVKAFKILDGVDFSLIRVIADLLRIELDFVSHCQISARPLGLFANIDASNCFEPVYIQFLRLISTLITTIPLIVFISRPKMLRRVYKDEVSRKKAILRMHCVLAALPFPGMIYFLGLISVEHYTVIIGLLGFVFLDRFRIIIPLMACSSLFDFGNTIVASFFFLNLYLVDRIDKGTVPRLLIVGYGVTVAVVLMVSGVSILQSSFFQFGELAKKSNAIYYALSYGSASVSAEKYNILLRPLMTISSLVLITPAYVKAPAAFLALTLWFVQSTLSRSPNKDKVRIRTSYWYFGAALFSICLCAITLPIYAYGKYYAICLPALLGIFVAKQGAQRVILYSAGLSIVTILNILVFWL